MAQGGMHRRDRSAAQARKAKPALHSIKETEAGK